MDNITLHIDVTRLHSEKERMFGANTETFFEIVYIEEDKQKSLKVSLSDFERFIEQQKEP